MFWAKEETASNKAVAKAKNFEVMVSKVGSVRKTGLQDTGFWLIGGFSTFAVSFSSFHPKHLAKCPA
jgi:hypothetical protein